MTLKSLLPHFNMFFIKEYNSTWWKDTSVWKGPARVGLPKMSPLLAAVSWPDDFGSRPNMHSKKGFQRTKPSNVDPTTPETTVDDWEIISHPSKQITK